MTNSFPMPEDQQFLLDRDGTIGFYLNSSNAGQVNLTAANLTTLIDWNDTTALGDTAVNTHFTYVFLFPELRNITALSAKFTYTTTVQSPVVEYSTDTTNGINGTWTQAVAGATMDQFYNSSTTKLRQYITLSLVGIKALRFKWGTGTTNLARWWNINLWGNYTRAGLEFLEVGNTNTISSEDMNFTDVYPGDVLTKTFRIRNNHTLQANNVVVGLAASPNIGQTAAGVQFSLDDITYTATVTVPSIAAAAISGTIYMKRTIPAGAIQNNFGVTAMTATATTWT